MAHGPRAAAIPLSTLGGGDGRGLPLGAGVAAHGLPAGSV